jgi:hypothetical protein
VLYFKARPILLEFYPEGIPAFDKYKDYIVSLYRFLTPSGVDLIDRTIRVSLATRPTLAERFAWWPIDFQLYLSFHHVFSTHCLDLDSISACDNCGSLDHRSGCTKKVARAFRLRKLDSKRAASSSSDSRNKFADRRNKTADGKHICRNYNNGKPCFKTPCTNAHVCDKCPVDVVHASSSSGCPA